MDRTRRKGRKLDVTVCAPPGFFANNPQVIRTDRQIVGFGNVVNYGSDKLRFVSPVPAGSVVHCRSRVIAGTPAKASRPVTATRAVPLDTS